MFNTPKMKLPEKHTEVFKTYKNGTPEEKAEIEDDFIKEINDKDSEFYSPMTANMNEHELRAMLRMMPSLIDTGDDNDD
ncbi:phage protein [Staphylococcus aureus]|nr:phage protein [Staphylococcus aureus]